MANVDMDKMGMMVLVLLYSGTNGSYSKEVKYLVILASVSLKTFLYSYGSCLS